MTLTALKKAIRKLPENKRTALATWLARLERAAWDVEIRKDFSPGGLGMPLLKKVDDQISRGNYKPLG